VVPADVLQVLRRTRDQLVALRAQVGLTEIPDPPPLSAGLRSGAVFNGLRRTYVFVRRILVSSGFPALALGEVTPGNASTPSSQSLMMAQLLYSQVARMAAVLPDDGLSQGQYFPGPTTSANVYAVSHQLELMAWELSEAVKETPTWLESSTATLQLNP
jgi:hypothetical protein